MKIVIFATLLVVVLVLSGCVQSETENTSDDNPLLVDGEDSDSGNTSSDMISSKDSFFSTLNSGLEMKCVLSKDGSKVTVYFTKDKVKAYVDVPQVGNMYTLIDNKEKMAYIWSDKEIYTPEMLNYFGVTPEPGKKIGAKTSITDQVDASQNNEMSQASIVNPEDYQIDWDCGVSTEQIALPDNYQFVDFSKLQQQMIPVN